MRSVEAFAKINLALVVGPLRPDGKHEVVTVLQRIDLADTFALDTNPEQQGITVDGFDDTTVRAALAAFSELAGVRNGWRAKIDKRIPVAAGLGGGSADAGAALRLANELCGEPLTESSLHTVARRVGADVPFFLRPGAQLATGDGTDLVPVSLPGELRVVLVLAAGEQKRSTATVYGRFDERGGAEGFGERRAALLAAVEGTTTVGDLATWPGNDLASSPAAGELVRLGAVRADVSGAGPAVYGLFEDESDAERAARELRSHGQTWLTRTVSGP